MNREQLQAMRDAAHKYLLKQKADYEYEARKPVSRSSPASMLELQALLTACVSADVQIAMLDAAISVTPDRKGEG